MEFGLPYSGNLVRILVWHFSKPWRNFHHHLFHDVMPYKQTHSIYSGLQLLCLNFYTIRKVQNPE